MFHPHLNPPPSKGEGYRKNIHSRGEGILEESPLEGGRD